MMAITSSASIPLVIVSLDRWVFAVDAEVTMGILAARFRPWRDFRARVCTEEAREIQV